LLQGCPQIDSFHISIIEQDVFLPTAFSPNGDGNNDMFRVTARKLVTLQEFKVMNRWGQLIFETKDISKGWDGTFKGKIVPAGIYNWTIRTKDALNDKKHEFTGSINVLR
jgi:gliding motility-associated-like protein